MTGLDDCNCCLTVCAACSVGTRGAVFPMLHVKVDIFGILQVVFVVLSVSEE